MDIRPLSFNVINNRTRGTIIYTTQRRSNMKSNKLTIATIAGLTTMAGVASATEINLENEANLFMAENTGMPLNAIADDKEGSCGEGSCGEESDSEDSEGACGEGSCGEESEDKEGACGEGTCGAS